MYIVLGAGVIGLTTILEIEEIKVLLSMQYLLLEIPSEILPLHTYWTGMARTRYIMQLTMALRREITDKIYVSYYSEEFLPISRCKWETAVL